MALLSLSSLQTPPQHTDGSYLSQVECRERLFCPLDHWVQPEKGDVLQGTGTFHLPAHQEAARPKAHSNFGAGFEGTFNESGIPATTPFPKHPVCWVVAVVPGETKIELFSVGNTVPVGQGCIPPGCRASPHPPTKDTWDVWVLGKAKRPPSSALHPQLMLL